ncbi:MAG: M20 family peptidase, partial [Gemmatimonadota bacterium]
MIRPLAVAALLVAAPLHAQLSPTEREISTYIRGHVEDGIDLLTRQVRIGSGTQNFEGIRRMYDLLAPELRELGF